MDNIIFAGKAICRENDDFLMLTDIAKGEWNFHSPFAISPYELLNKFVFPKKFSLGKCVSRHLGLYLLLYSEKLHDFAEVDPADM